MDFIHSGNIVESPVKMCYLDSVNCHLFPSRLSREPGLLAVAFSSLSFLANAVDIFSLLEKIWDRVDSAFGSDGLVKYFLS